MYSFKSEYRGNLKDVINVIIKYAIVLYHKWRIIINISISIFIIRFLLRGLFVYGNVRHKTLIHFDILSAIKEHIKVALLSENESDTMFMLQYNHKNSTNGSNFFNTSSKQQLQMKDMETKL